ncbi:MAG: M1 family metallopeptidase [Bacteroidota bacterium]
MNISIRLFFFSSTMFFLQPVAGQLLHKQEAFTHQDTLRGSLNPERTWWDVTYYNITVQPDYVSKTIRGRNVISFKVLSSGKRMQIDMQEPMEINEVVLQASKLSFEREGNVYHINVPEGLEKGSIEQLNILFSGKPREAIRPPWDGGWIWKKDANGNPWMSVACQGLGASVWYPCKDIQSDEPDNGASLTMIVPDTLVAVGNGRLKEKKNNHDGTSTYTWQVVNPINNYNIVPYIGKYVNFAEVFDGEKGKLDCSYWVLDYNLEKAKEQFKQVALMLKCFEYWFGPYPFYEDSYKLVEAPHLGMEHQSAVGYGNKFGNGYLGRDLSGTGWGLKWDFIIVHESGHEWFANNITSKDLADMWIHEGITNYSETLFTECQFGKEAGRDYVIGTRKNITNTSPIIAPYGVNREGSGDMYYKGGNMMHTIRQVINNDSTFRNILRGLNKTFYHQTVTTQQVESYISQQSGIDFSKVFDQYLRTIKIPVFEYKIENGKLSYRWNNCVKGFNLALKIDYGDEDWLKPTEQWQEWKLPEGVHDFTVDRNFYVDVKKLGS